MPSRVVSFTLNGQTIEVLVKPLATLQTVLREQLAYTGTKIGCRQGSCGSCTVLVNGQAMLSCLLPVEDVAGQEITTVEGLTPLEGLHPIQQAFLDNFATQCGYCTPGMILVTKALIEQNPKPSREQILEALTGNICRCTGYEPIIRAVQDAAQRLNSGKGA
jgi:carbon-monoxide dehydrogenase small subunit